MRLVPRRIASGQAIESLVNDGLPIGDFDQVAPPPRAPRLYRTQGGWRVFYTDHPAGSHGLLMRDLLLAGCDPRYIIYASINGFSTRVSPKTNHPEPWCVARFVHQKGPIHQDWLDYISEHDRLTRANTDGTLC
jgi:hypothetical protein